MDTLEFCWFRHDAHKASRWFQRSVVNFASPEEGRGSSLLPKLVATLFLILVAMARFLVASLIWDITATLDLTLMERVNLRKQWMVYLFVEWVSILIWCQSYSDQFGNSQRSLLSPTGCVKSILPVTENRLRKLYNYSMNNDKSTEDNETNHINNKCNDMNTRKMHNTWAWTQARTLSHSLMSGHMHLLAQVWVSSLVIHVHVRLSLSSPLSSSTSTCPFPVFFFSFHLLHFELHTELHNLIAMQNLRNSANKVSDYAYDVHTSLTKRMSNVADSGEEHSIIWWMFMVVTMHAATFMEKNFQNNQNSMNTSDLTLKKMFDISAKSVSEEDEIFQVDTIPLGKTLMEISVIDWWWNHHQSFQRAKVYVLSDSVLCLGRVHQYPKSNEAWRDRIGWITTVHSYRDYDGINGEPTEFEWNIVPGFTTLQLCGKATWSTEQFRRNTRKLSQEEFYLCR